MGGVKTVETEITQYPRIFDSDWWKAEPLLMTRLSANKITKCV